MIAVNARILEAFTDHLMNQKRLLTPEEQRLFFDHIRRRSQDSGRRPNPM